MKTRLAIPIFVLIGMVILSGCALRRSSEKEAWTESIPSNVNFIVSVRLSELLADQDVVSLVGSLNLVNLLSSAREEIGIDLRQVARLTVFGDLDTDEYFGVLIEGGVEPKLLLTSFEASLNESPSLEGYKGHDVYVFSDDGLALVWLDLDTVLASSSDSEMAHDVIDILEGDANSASGPVIELLGSLGDPWLKASLEAPEELLGDGGQIIPGLDLGLLTDIQLIGLVVDKKQSDFQLEVSLQYPTEKSAEAAVDVLDSLITLVTAFTDDRLASELIDQIEISSAGSTVTVAYSATVDELLSAVEELPGLLEGTLFGFSRESIPIEETDNLTTTPTNFGYSTLLADELHFPATGPVSREHIPAGQSALGYSSDPPTSGPHWSELGVAPTPWGIKSGEIPYEALVHNLEHGGIIIQYKPTAPQSLIDQLTSFVQQQPDYPEGYILAPRSNLPSTIILSAWEYYLPLLQINEHQMMAFIKAHYDHAPETLQGQLR